MSNWLQITLGGIKMVYGVVLMADSVSSGSTLCCLMNGSLAVAPFAWAIASSFVSDN